MNINNIHLRVLIFFLEYEHLPEGGKVNLFVDKNPVIINSNNPLTIDIVKVY